MKNKTKPLHEYDKWIRVLFAQMDAIMNEIVYLTRSPLAAAKHIKKLYELQMEFEALYKYAEKMDVERILDQWIEDGSPK